MTYVIKAGGVEQGLKLEVSKAESRGSCHFLEKDSEL